MSQNGVEHSAVKVDKVKPIQMLLPGKTAVYEVLGSVVVVPVCRHSPLAKWSIGHSIYHISIRICYLFYTPVVIGIQIVQLIAIILYIYRYRVIAYIYIIVVGVGCEILLILPATINFLFLLCVVNGISGHSPLLVGIIINSITFIGFVYCVGLQSHSGLFIFFT